MLYQKQKRLAEIEKKLAGIEKKIVDLEKKKKPTSTNINTLLRLKKDRATHMKKKADLIKDISRLENNERKKQQRINSEPRISINGNNNITQIGNNNSATINIEKSQFSDFNERINELIPQITEPDNQYKIFLEEYLEIEDPKEENIKNLKEKIINFSGDVTTNLVASAIVGIIGMYI